MPLNVMIHNHLVSMGYVLKAYAAHFWDDGDGESGPHLDGHPAYDVYESPDHRIVVDHRGHVDVFEDRDLAFERWCDEQAAACAGDAHVW